MSQARAIAKEFLTDCHEKSWHVTTDRGIVTISTTFPPGDKDAYVAADGESYNLLATLPRTGGSAWGTTGDGVGGDVGLTKGYYRLNASGVQKRVLTALTTEIAKLYSPDNMAGR